MFHTLDYSKEVDFDFDNSPKSFIDVETGEKIDLYAANIKEHYQKALKNYNKAIELACAKYQIKYVAVDTTKSFDKIINTYLTERQRFV